MMFDRRTAVRREWSVWWRYAVVLSTFELVAVVVTASGRGSPQLLIACAGFLVLHAMVQLIILGIATAIFVRYHVRTSHVWSAAAISNAPVLAASFAPYAYWAPCYLVATVLTVASFIYIARVSLSIADPRLGYLCAKCFYDIRGLPGSVCPECGTRFTCEQCSYDFRGSSLRECPRCAP